MIEESADDEKRHYQSIDTESILPETEAEGTLQTGQSACSKAHLGKGSEHGIGIYIDPDGNLRRYPHPLKRLDGPVELCPVG